MIIGRDDEFRGTITALYWQELGRAPDPGGMASWLDHCRNGMTGAQLQQLLYDSPEGVAYRARPRVAEVPAIIGRDFVNAHGQRVVLNGCDGFMDFRLFRDGVDLAPFFRESVELGFGMRRVFFQGAKSQNQVMDLSPREPGYYDDVPRYVQAANDAGLLVLATIGVDNQIIGMGYDHWARMWDIFRGHGVIPSGGNEASKNGFDRALIPDPRMPAWSRGSEQADGLPMQGATVLEFHPRRDLWTSLRDAVASPVQIHEILGWNQPLLIDEPPKMGTNGSAPKYADPGLCRRFAQHYSAECAGAVFHNWFGQRGMLMSDQTKRCAEAWTKGMQI